MHHGTYQLSWLGDISRYRYVQWSSSLYVQTWKIWKYTSGNCVSTLAIAVCSQPLKRKHTLALAARAAAGTRFGCTCSDKEGGLLRPTDRKARFVASPKISPRFAAGFLNAFCSSFKCAPANCIPAKEHGSINEWILKVNRLKLITHLGLWRNIIFSEPS
jgi:hypothetical protein